jgi:hypothetical protein
MRSLQAELLNQFLISLYQSAAMLSGAEWTSLMEWGLEEMPATVGNLVLQIMLPEKAKKCESSQSLLIVTFKTLMPSMSFYRQ